MKKKITLDVVENAKKNAEQSLKNIAPIFKDFSDQIKKLGEMNKSMFTYEKIPHFLPSRPATAAEIADILERREKKRISQVISADPEIIFNKNEKQLVRYIGQKKLSYKFSKGKRFNLFNLFVSSSGYKETETLREKLGCPTKNAVEKLVAGINDRVKINLKIKNRIIEGREGFGYRINPEFTIIEE